MLVSAPAKGLKWVIRHQGGYEQEPAATTERAGAKRRCTSEWRQLYRQHGENSVAGTAAASAPLTSAISS
ncbi:hypothetical protein QDX92_004287 [Salmonella enterica]|nr:hypothetical protein [Salmonella enterica]EJF5536493.1 hypothetical protein [Salmonella enterica]EJF5652786.1 hypothetical protein [Salmonella enterica]EJF5921748.1 hypothetical protein [Salmonella enterica]EJF5944400.1 hypothetical protein [Salmonella enterica]